MQPQYQSIVSSACLSHADTLVQMVKFIIESLLPPASPVTLVFSEWAKRRCKIPTVSP